MIVRSNAGMPLKLLLVLGLGMCVFASVVGAQVTSGAYTGDGDDGREITGLGFQPDFVIIKADLDEFAVCRTSTMASGNSKFLAEVAGMQSGCILDFTGDGFLIGTDPSVNTPDVIYHWTAFRAVEGLMTVGTYTGTGLIHEVGLGFQPACLVVLGEGGYLPYHRTSAMPVDQCLAFDNTSLKPDLILDFSAGGFWVGGDEQVNEPDMIVHYVAWPAMDLLCASGTYAGDAVDGRDIRGLTLAPEFVLIKTESNKSAAMRGRSLGAVDLTLDVMDAAAYADGIQQLYEDGFQLGSNIHVNNLIFDYYWTAFGEYEDLDLDLQLDKLSASPGDTLTCTLTVINHGPGNAQSFGLEVVLPPDLQFESAVADSGAFDAETGVWSLAGLHYDTSAALQITALVSQTPLESELEVTAAVIANTHPDPVAGNDTAAAIVTLSGLADLELLLGADTEAPASGASFDLILTVKNRGPEEATGLAADFPLPAGLSYQSHLLDQGDFDAGSGLWQIGALAAGDSATLQITAQMLLDLAVGDTLSVVAELQSLDQYDPNRADNSAVLFFGSMALDLAILAEASVAACNEGDSVSLELFVQNNSLQEATGVSVQLTIDEGLLLQNHNTASGTFFPETGIWTIGALDPGHDVRLSLQCAIDAGTNGMSIGGTATIATSDRLDPDPSDNTDVFAIYVYSADLKLDKTVDQTNPNVGDLVSIMTTLINVGPDPASGVLIDDLLPDGLVLQQAISSDGSYDELSGQWFAGSLGVGEGAILVLKALVDASVVGAVLSDTTRVANADQGDPDPLSNLASVELLVQSADVSLALGSDVPAPGEDTPVTIRLLARNNGPDAAEDLQVRMVLSDGLILQSSEADAGDLDVETGIWTPGRLEPADSTALFLHCLVDDRTGGSLQTCTAEVAVVRQADPLPENDSALLELPIPLPDHGHFLVSATPLPAGGLTPGGAVVDLMRLQMVNWSVAGDTLQSLRFANAAGGVGTIAQLDADWTSMALRLRNESGSWVEVGGATFASANLQFNGLGLACAPGDTLDFLISGGASSTARTGDLLAFRMTGEDQITFNRMVSTTADWPLSTETHTVAGISSHQITLNKVPPIFLPIAASRCLIMDFIVPANGYAPAVLSGVSLTNGGTAGATDIARVEIWRDNGDGLFSAATDILLGEAVPVSGVRRLSNLSVDVGVQGVRLFTTVDLTNEAVGGRTVRMTLPADIVKGLQYADGISGPVDQPVFSPNDLVISNSNRIYIAARDIAAQLVRPGSRQVPLLSLSAVNTYGQARELSSLRLQVDVGGPDGASAATALSGLSVYAREEPTAESVLLATAGVSSGTIVCSGLDLVIPAGATRYIDVYADVSLFDATDADTLGLVIDGGSDIIFSESTDFVAGFPLSSNADHVIDGSIALQYPVTPGDPVTLSRGDGPVIAMDVQIPANGLHEDRLQSLRLVDSGTVSAADLAEMRLWADDGDGVLDPAGGLDVDLGQMVFDTDGWLIPDLDLLVPAGGVRLLASVVISDTPIDSTIIDLSLPVGGAQFQSGNDGPIDMSVSAGREFLLSDSPLLASLLLVEDAASTGQVLTAEMTIRNAGSETIVSISPSLLTASQSGLVTLLSGPLPATIDLDPGASDTLRWTYSVTASGSLYLSGSCSGTGNTGGSEFQTLAVNSETVQLYDHADELGVQAIANLPFSVNRGQQGLSAMTLSLFHEGVQDMAPIRLDALRFRLLSQTGTALPVGQILNWVELKSGSTLLLHRELGGSSETTVTLNLTSLFAVSPSELKQATMSLGLAQTGSAAGFRIQILDAPSITASDLISGERVVVSRTVGDFPIETGYTVLVDEAEAVQAYCPTSPVLTVGKGQHGALLMNMVLENTATDGLTAGVQVGSIAVQLRDVNGALLTNPQLVTPRINVLVDDMPVLEREVRTDDGPVFLIQFPSPLQLDSGDARTLSIRGDIADETLTTRYSLRLASLSLFDVRDINSGAAVAVQTPADSSITSIFKIQDLAASLLMTGDGLAPARLTRGARRIDLISVLLNNPGLTDQAATRLDTLKLHVLGADGVELDPTGLLDNISVQAGESVFRAEAKSFKSVGAVIILTRGLSIEPGVTTELVVSADIIADAPQDQLEFILDTGDLCAADNNLNIPVPVVPAPDMPLTLSSGVARLLDPAGELRIDWQDRLPVTISALEDDVPVVDMLLTNTGGEQVGDILLTAFTLRAANQSLRPVLIGSIATEVRLVSGDMLIASSGELGGSDSLAVMTPVAPLVISPDLGRSLQIHYVPRSDVEAGTLRLGFDAQHVSCSQPFGVIYPITKRAPSGASFPFWTEVATLMSADLSASYSNYPNPFAAGRARTTFTYVLKTGASVTLEILTPHGEKVAEICSNEHRDPGAHQEDVWDGCNERGRTVANGVYLAVLSVSFDDGTSERVLRKVAVVR